MNNEDRAERAHEAVLAYQGEDGEFYLHDLICDLGHWLYTFGPKYDAGENGTLREACDRGIEGFLEELAEEEADNE